MEITELKQAIGRCAKQRIELTLIVCIVAAGYLIQGMVPHKLIAMNVLFLPTVLAAYFLGSRSGGLTALFSFLIIAVYAIASPERFVFQGTRLLLVFDLVIWGSFLGLTALVVGSLCDRSRRQLRELKSAYLGVLEILTRFLEMADHYTKNHSVRVAELSTSIAAEMGLNNEEIENIRAGALLHDVGKTDSIDLVKRASALDESQQRTVASHTLSGAALVRSVGSILQEAVPIIRFHHQYYGGREGQDGPVGEAIPLGARIVAVADAYDAIVTDRPYRMGRAPWQALADIEDCVGTQFDPKVVAALSRILPGDSVEPERDLEELRSTAGGPEPSEAAAQRTLEALSAVLDSESSDEGVHPSR